ncbi:hypothetical protein [Paenibacillus agri]|uniref:Uncharacterized protein n=1 Tax=Paenibacillus agri TaxID=2744309 RepID=A0A850ELS2_9BACL|nr:hypothetical protein [Paenibacillus agri]NUU60457.1 hypothetical protein [Paenibacillus agri]
MEQWLGLNKMPSGDDFQDIAQEELALSSWSGYGNQERNAKPAMKNAIAELIVAMAADEVAIAQLIRAEASNIEAFAGKEGEFPTSPTNQQIIDFQHEVARVMETIVEKQKLFLRMIETSVRLLHWEGEGDSDS